MLANTLGHESHAPFPVFAPTLLIEQLGGDEALARIIVGSGMKDLPGYFEGLAQAAAQGDWQEVRRTMHTLKGLLAQLGAPCLTQILGDAQWAMKQGEGLGAAQVATLMLAYRQLMAELDRWLQAGPT
jgi:HPt (histidine-containing phosphotransfer) domain-containing protein